MVSGSSYDPSAAEKRLLVHIFEDKARKTPHAIFASIPLSGEPDGCYKDITFAVASNAVDYLVNFLERSFPQSERSGKFDVISYIGPSDVRYALLTYAAIKSKLQILMPSMSDTAAMNLSLLERTGCRKLVYAEETAGLAEELVEGGSPIKFAVVPTIQYLLTSSSQPRPYEISIEEGLFHPILILHSSGSTGLVTIRTITNGFLATLGADYAFTAPTGRLKTDITIHNFEGAGGRIMSSFPLTHLTGFLVHIAYPIYTKCATVWAPSNRPPTANSVMKMLESLEIDGMILPPTVIEDVVNRPKGLDLVTKLTNLAYAGGPLSQDTGQLIAGYVHLYQDYGSTEALKVRTLRPRPEDWDWLEFHPDDYYRFEEAENGAYELVLLRDPLENQSYSGAAAIRFTVPKETEYRTKDLFTPHATNSHLWKFYGRRDDILILLSGERINPMSMERAIARDKIVSGALIVGRFKPCAAVIIELSKNATRDDELQATLWEVVQKANAGAPVPARLSRELIILADDNKPLKRSTVGNVIRKASTALYAREIDQAYEAAGLIAKAPLPRSVVDEKGKTDRSAHLSSILKQIVGRLLGNVSHGENAEMCYLGLKSTEIAELVRELRLLLGNPVWLTTKIFYAKPTFPELLQAIEEKFRDARKSDARSIFDIGLLKFAEEYKSNPFLIDCEYIMPSCVCITGTTEFLGRYMLLTLLKNAGIGTIHCLNRAKDARQQFFAFCRDLDWSRPFPDTTRLVFHHIDLGDHNAFKSKAVRRALESSQVFLHIAWKADLNLPVTAFKQNLSELRNLIDGFQSVVSPPRLVFASSISCVHNMKYIHSSPLPIALRNGSGSGHADSKLFAEQMLINAAATENVKVTILRIGQIAPPRDDANVAWPQHEWLPSLVKTSHSLGRIPNDLPDIAVIPVNALSRMILELSAAGGLPAIIFNLVNRNPIPWKHLVETIIGGNPALKQTSLEDWIAALEKCERSDLKELQSKPALRNLDHFKVLAAAHGQTTYFDTELTAMSSFAFDTHWPVRVEELASMLARG